MPRLDTHVTTKQALAAFRRLEESDQDFIEMAAKRLQDKAKLDFADALCVLASIGLYAVLYDG